MTQTAGFVTETTAEVFRPFALVSIGAPSGTVYLWTGVGNLSWNSQTWTGAGDLGSIGSVSAGTDLAASQVELTLSGLDATIKADVINELIRGADVSIYYGFFDSSDAIVADPWLGFFGKVDAPTVADAAAGTTISISVLDGVGAMLRRTKRRRTDADHQDTFSGDEIFEFVATASKNVHWGQPDAAGGGGVNARGGESVPGGVRRQLY